MAKKKSYNPFKMWGSYGGVIIGYFIGLIYFIMDRIVYCGDPSITCDYIINWTIFFYVFNIIGMLFIIGGFLIGWGIHSIVRSARK